MTSRIVEKVAAQAVVLKRLTSNRGDRRTHAISYLPRFTAFFIPLLVLAASVLMPVAQATAANCHVYAVNLQGTASVGDGTFTSSSQPFSVIEYAIWRDAGVRTHQVEFLLTTFQDLNAAAQVGQIELMTNSYFARNAGIASAAFDLAAVAVANGVSFEIDSAMSFQLPPPNVFIAPGIGSVSGGLGGLGFLTGAGAELAQLINSAPILSVSYFVPRTGGGYFATDSSGYSITGQLNLVGTGPDNVSFQGQYQANFSGNYVGSVQCN
jgi:hypothetical protein